MRRDWPFLKSVQIGHDQTFFHRHGLLFLPPDQLERIEGHLVRMREDLKRGPLGVDLLSDAPAEDTSWFDESALDRLGLPEEACAHFRHLLHKDTAPDPSEAVPEPLRGRMLGKLPDGRFVGLVQALLSRPSSDIEFVREVTARAHVLMDRAKRHNPGLEIGVEGPYNDLRAVDSLLDNGTIATVVSVLLTLAIMFAVFRRAGPILLVLGQAAISCALTLGFATLVYGRLNLYTMFVIAILFGMGTDYSFYVIGYAQRLVRAGATWEDALIGTFRDLSGSLLVAWGTTVAGLMVLLLSDFPGFHEFGVIASMGITTSLLLTWIFLPASVFATLQTASRPGLGWLSPSTGPLRLRPLATRPWMRRVPRFTALAAMLAALCLAPFASRLGFEYDFANLEDTGSGWAHACLSRLRSVGSGIPVAAPPKAMPVKEALGNGPTSSQPVVVMARDAATMEKVHEALAGRRARHDPLLAGFLTLRSFLPRAEDQRLRAPYLDSIARLLSDPVFDKASGQDSVAVAELRDMAKARPYGISDLPAWSLDLLRERDGSIGRTGLVYNAILTADSREAEKFQGRYAHFDEVPDGVTCFASNFIYADLVRMVRDDSRRMSWIMGTVLCALLLLVFRRWRAILVCAIGMAVAVGLTVGTMGLLGVRLNAFNLIVITTLQAALTDVVIYLVLAWERHGRTGIRRLYTHMGTLMAIAIGTTMSGYAGMLFTSHQGIRSIGSFALIGLGFCLVGSLATVPWLCAWLLPPESKEA
jgi:hypothetical protein